MLTVFCNFTNINRPLNPKRTGGCFPPGSRFFANNVGSNKGTQSKLSDFPKI